MTSILYSTHRRTHAPLARMLAVVLCAFVTYTATVESAHNHGGAIIATPSRSVAAAANIARSNNDNSSLKKQFNGGDCLICQFYQHLSGGLFTALPSVASGQTQQTPSPASVVFVFSQTCTSQRGRAPPAASLS